MSLQTTEEQESHQIPRQRSMDEAAATGISSGIAYLENSPVTTSVHHHHYQEPELSEAEIKILEVEFFKAMNDTSRKECQKDAGNVFANSAIANSSETNKAHDVYPELARTNFFQGEPGIEEVNYSAEAHRGWKPKEKRREFQVFKEEIHNNGRYVILVGAAGSGKTTLVKRYALLALDGKLENGPAFKNVHFVNIRDRPGEKFTPKKFLFDDIVIGDHNKKCVQYGYKCLQKEENQSSLLFIFDGLDTAPWNLDDKYHGKMSYDDEKPPATIMFNILSGHLFPKCHILLASREYGVAQFRPELHPEAVVAMRGLSLESMKILVEKKGGDKSSDIWKAIQDKSQNLMQLCSNPLFLTLVILIYQKMDKPPTTFSGIIIELVESHIRSKNRLVPSEKIPVILECLRKLSYLGLTERKVIFSTEDLKNVGLSPDDVKDLVVRSTKEDKDHPFDQLLLPQDYWYFFCHQAFQEAFAAQHASKLEEKKFREVAKTDLRDGKYIVVRQFICGILFNEDAIKRPVDKLQDEDRKGKMEIILKMLSEDIEQHAEHPKEMLNLLISLRECCGHPKVQKMVKSTLKKICLAGIPLSPSDLHAVASVACYSDKLSIMQLMNCQLDKRSLETLVEVMKRSNVEITVFDVSFNSNLRSDSMYYLHKICIRGQGLNYWQCGFRQHHILDFVDKDEEKVNANIHIQSTKDRIEMQYKEDGVLDLDAYNVKHHSETLDELVRCSNEQNKPIRVNIVEYTEDTEILSLCRILQSCKYISELAISESHLDGKQLEVIKNALEDREITSLNVYLCTKIHPNGWQQVGEIAAQNLAKNLFITSCSLNESGLQRMKRALRDKKAKIVKLDVSRNDDMHANCYSEIGQIVKTCEIKELVMGYCNMEADQIKSLDERLQNAKLDRLDLSGNENIGPDGFKIVGELVKRCEMKQLDISECDPCPTELENFKVNTNDAKLKKLNVSRNRNMGEKGLQHVAEIAGQCEFNELFVRQCELEQKTLRSFQNALPPCAKIRNLDFGLYFMKPKVTTDEEIKILIDILPHVTEKLTLNGWKLTVDMKSTLQQAIDAVPYRGLTVVFDRGQNIFIEQKFHGDAID